MADDQTKSYAVRDAMIFIGTIILLFIMWLSIGGPNREEATSGKFIESGGSGEVYDEKLLTEENLQGAKDKLTNPLQR